MPNTKEIAREVTYKDHVVSQWTRASIDNSPHEYTASAADISNELKKKGYTEWYHPNVSQRTKRYLGLTASKILVNVLLHPEYTDNKQRSAKIEGLNTSHCVYSKAMKKLIHYKFVEERKKGGSQETRLTKEFLNKMCAPLVQAEAGVVSPNSAIVESPSNASTLRVPDSANGTKLGESDHEKERTNMDDNDNYVDDEDFVMNIIDDKDDDDDGEDFVMHITDEDKDDDDVRTDREVDGEVEDNRRDVEDLGESKDEDNDIGGNILGRKEDEQRKEEDKEESSTKKKIDNHDDDDDDGNVGARNEEEQRTEEEDDDDEEEDGVDVIRDGDVDAGVEDNTGEVGDDVQDEERIQEDNDDDEIEYNSDDDDDFEIRQKALWVDQIVMDLEALGDANSIDGDIVQEDDNVAADSIDGDVVQEDDNVAAVSIPDNSSQPAAHANGVPVVTPPKVKIATTTNVNRGLGSIGYAALAPVRQLENDPAAHANGVPVVTPTKLTVANTTNVDRALGSIRDAEMAPLRQPEDDPAEAQVPLENDPAEAQVPLENNPAEAQVPSYSYHHWSAFY